MGRVALTPATILSWRTRLGLNKTEAAKALGLSRNGYDYYETGRYRIPLHVGLACSCKHSNITCRLLMINLMSHHGPAGG
jgi:DNA-binding XRE family transcriptional regulator